VLRFVYRLDGALVESLHRGAPQLGGSAAAAAMAAVRFPADAEALAA
jgi:hypothetical protein